MSWSEKLQEVSVSLVTTVLVALGSGVIWVVRRVVTNQKQIELLQVEIANRDALRQRDREDFAEIKRDVKSVRSRLDRFLGETK